MKVVILSIGSLGDLQPYLALGLQLQKSGHAVRLAASIQYKSQVEKLGLEFFPLQIEVMPDPQAKSKRTTKPPSFIQMINLVVERLVGPVYYQVLAACTSMEAVVYSPFAGIAYFAARELHLPQIVAPLQPVSRTGEFPFLMAPQWSRLGAGYNHLSYLAAEQAIWLLARKAVNQRLVKPRGLAPIPMSGPISQIYKEQIPVIYGFSPQVVPKPKDWPRAHAVTGYWLLDAAKDWQPTKELSDFLEAGPPPVYIGFGSTTFFDARETTNLIMDALRQTGRRGLLARGWGGLSEPEVDKDVLMVGSVPHDWLFPRMATIVHHGGAGTTAAALRAGVPAVVVPQFADQAFWARRVFALGAGPRPIPRTQLDANKLAGAIRQATSDYSMRTQAARLGEEIRAERGAERAVDLISAYMERRAPGLDKTLN